MSKKEKAEVAINEPVVEAVVKANNEDYKKICRNLNTAVKSIETNIIKVARGLAEIHTRELYRIGGYDNIYAFAKDRYNISRGTCSNYIGLVQFFGIDTKYNYAQMSVMLPYLRNGGSAEDFNPDMSSREIKKAIKEKQKADDDVIDGEYKEVVEEVAAELVAHSLIEFKTKPEYEKLVDDIDTLILNAFKKYKNCKKIEIICYE